MDEIFLPPPFDASDMLGRILGPEAEARAAPAGRAAALPGHSLVSDADGIRIGLVETPGASVAGRLLASGMLARARLDFAMAAFGAAPAAVTVEVDGGAAPALAYRFPPGGRWFGEEAAGERRARLSEILVEVMGHFGRRDAGEMQRLMPGIAIRALARARGPATLVPRRLGAGLGAADVRPEAREFSYARYFGIEEHRLRHRRFDGGMSEMLDRAVFTSGDAVTVLPFDARAGAVLLIEQFRAAPWARRDPHPWCLETIAGRCDRAEPPETTARREAGEEAGLALGRIERIGGYYPSPGIAGEYITAFVGEADLGAAGGTHGLAEEHEDIRALVVPLEAAMAALEAGEIRNAPLMLSLYWLERNARRLRAAWA